MTSRSDLLGRIPLPSGEEVIESIDSAAAGEERFDGQARRRYGAAAQNRGRDRTATEGNGNSLARAPEACHPASTISVGRNGNQEASTADAWRSGIRGFLIQLTGGRHAAHPGS